MSSRARSWVGPMHRAGAVVTCGLAALVMVPVAADGGTAGATDFAAPPTAPKTVTFDRVGVFDYTVPSGVTALTVLAYGAQGGTSTTGRFGFTQRRPGGKGGQATARVPVSPGQTFRIRVGGAGGSDGFNRPGGFNGGGDSGGNPTTRGGGGGGGASDVRNPADGLDNRIIVAGGGGGGAPYYEPPSTEGGAGGGAVGGDGAGASPNRNRGGGGGGQSGGGGPGYDPHGATAGTKGKGGTGGLFKNSFMVSDGGGGGGGGYYGGGGGAASTDPLTGSGGGGSGFVAPGLSGALASGVRAGNGLVKIIEDPGTPPTITCPPAPVGTVGQRYYRLRCDTTGYPTPQMYTVSGTAPPPKPHIDSSVYVVYVDWADGFQNQLTTAGTYAFTLSGSNGVFPDANVPVSITVNPRATSAKLGVSATQSTLGEPVTFTASVSATPTSIKPTGSVTLFDGATKLQSVSLSVDASAVFKIADLAGGTHSITAVYAGDANNVGSTSNPVQHQVNPAASTTAVSSSANPSKAGQPVTFTATVGVVGASKRVPTGTVQFVVDGDPFGAPVALTSGTATSTPTADLRVDTHTVSARYLGSSDFKPSDAAVSPDQRVDKASVAVALDSAPNPSLEGQTIVFTATARAQVPGAGTPTGDVDLLEGAKPIGHGSLVGGTAKINVSDLKDGAHPIIAVYRGDARFNGDTSPPVQQRVKDLRAIDVTPVQLTLRRGETFQLRATGRFADGSTEDLTTRVEWSSANPKAATISGTGLVTVLPNAPAGSVTIVARLFDTHGHASIVVSRAAETPSATPQPSPAPTSVPTTAPGPS